MAQPEEYQQVPGGAYQQTPVQGGGYQQGPVVQGGYQQASTQGGYQQAPIESGFQQQQQGGPPGPQSQSNGPEVTYKGEVPDEDVHEGNTQNQSPPADAPPPLSDMDSLQGYENTQFQADAYTPPPAYQPREEEQEESKPVDADIPRLSEDRARQALHEEVSQHCCYGKAAANELVFTNMVPSSAFHYQLETFTEGRKTAWAYDPYTGQPIDGPQNGIPPSPWNINVQPGEMFKNHEKHLEVPHTASIKMCHGCMGMGMNRCWKCRGRGRIICGTCDGTGRRLEPRIHHDHHHHHHHHHGGHHQGHHHHHQHGGSHIDMESVPCFACHGSGRKRCSVCHGCGQTTCNVCRGKQQLKCYIKLTVTWRNNKGDHVVERTALPDHLIRGAQGRMAFQDTQRRVFPVTGFPDGAVNRASKQLIDSHAVSFPTECILSQRHCIRIVPVTEAQCDFKSKRFNFWVYGDDCNVHAPDYPQQSCWGCSII